MRRRAFLAGVAGVLAAPLAAEAQREGNVPRIGYLFLQPWSATGHLREAFRQGLRELGYREGQNIDIEVRNAEGRLERLPALTAELVQLKVAVIVAAPEASVQAVKEATMAIPIVMAYSDDPVGRGFVNSLARPGGNITGLSTLGPELYGKQLELLKELVPSASRVVILWAPDDLSHTGPLKEIESAARGLGI
jgi:putative tryptophan/tyrosine transport system substrate-binding protein